MLDKLKQLWRKKLVRNTGWMMMGHGTRVVLQALYFVLAARWLGVQGLGVFSGALALAKIMLPFAGWGLDEVLARRVSRNQGEYPEAFGNALTVILISGSLFSLLAVAVSQVLFTGHVPWLFMLLIATAELVLYRLQLLVRRAFQAYERLNITAIFKAAPSFTLMAAIVGFRLTSEHSTMEDWGLWYFGAMAVPGVAGIVVMLALLGGPTFKSGQALGQLREGFFFSLAESAKTAYTDADKILLLRLMSKEVAGVYKAAYRVLSVLMTPVLALLDAAYAPFFKTGEVGVRGSFRFAVRLLPVSMLYGGAVGAGLFFAAPLLPWVLGPGYQETAQVVRWLAPIPLIQGASYMLMQTLTGGGSQRTRSTGQLVIAILNITGNVVLIPLYGWRACAVVAVASELILAVMMFLLCRAAARREERAEGDEEAPPVVSEPPSSQPKA
ncbi:MAG: oligosaccharide flippase family protein [Deltaproteobacteria bacterium]|nr:oligosaccharide flippase family protein [Deltaproteobacteria bacterium]